jgi:hypothetical protein
MGNAACRSASRALQRTWRQSRTSGAALSSATDRLGGIKYVDANRALNEKLARLKQQRSELAQGIRSESRSALLEASVRQFSDQARASFETCGDLETRQQFLAEHVERIIHSDQTVVVVGKISPLKKASGAEPEKVEFRMECKIDRRALKAKPRQCLPAWPGFGAFEAKRTLSSRHSR